MKLLTANEYVQQTGIVETGRLLANRDTITASGDDLSTYKTALYTSGDPTKSLQTAVKDDLDNIISDAQTKVEPQVRKLYEWPLTDDGFEIQTIPDLLKRIVKDIARYYLHDEDVPERIFERYRDALTTAEMIGKGNVGLPVDRLPSSKPQYTI
jgi:phage gp36-like protein